jgi:hypothetical protein
MEWQPISTAPKDGTLFLAFLAEPFEFGGQQICVGTFDADMEDWICDAPDGGWAFISPTHWVPIPAPPVAP